MDKFGQETRSFIMRRIKSKETGLEVSFRKSLWAAGLRNYRKNSKRYPGTPDVIFAPQKIVIFVDSCFWHGCKKHFRLPENNRDFWKRKIERNRERDKKTSAHYKKEGWKIYRLWEHRLKKDPAACISKIKQELRGRLTR